MARGRKVRTKRKRPELDFMDATPERLAKGDYSEFVETKVEGQSARTTKARRFRSTKLERLHKAGQISYVQFYAGSWYSNVAELANTATSSVSSYGQGTGGSVTFYAFLPKNIKQLDAREKLRAARAEMPDHMRGFMDRLLIRDAFPVYGGRQAMRTLDEIRKGLDSIARHLKLA